MKANRTLWSCAAILALGCHLPPPPPAAVGGEPADLVALHGEWVGDFHSLEMGRTGTIEFTLDATGATATGEVWMYSPRPPIPVGDELEAVVKPLPIEFVRCTGPMVRATLMPYADPICECTVVTEFVGTIDGDVIRGTYTTWQGDYEVARGRWSVERRRGTE